MSEPQWFSFARLWIPSAVVGLFPVYGYLASRPALVSKRSATAPAKVGTDSDLREQADDSRATKDIPIPLRMREDPLGPAYETLYLDTEIPLRQQLNSPSLEPSLTEVTNLRRAPSRPPSVNGSGI